MPMAVIRSGAINHRVMNNITVTGIVVNENHCQSYLFAQRKREVMLQRAYLKEYRTRAGQTLKQAAAKIGVAAQTVHKWEHAINSPSLPDLIKLAEAYGIPPSVLFISPDERALGHWDDKAIQAAAKMADVHPLALQWIGGDLTNIQEAEALTAILKIFQDLPPMFRDQWRKSGENFLELYRSLPPSAHKHLQDGKE